MPTCNHVLRSDATTVYTMVVVTVELLESLSLPLTVTNLVEPAGTLHEELETALSLHIVESIGS